MIKVPEVRDLAISYTRWRMLGIISMAMTMAIKAFFDGIGKTYVHLVAAIMMNIFNVALCWILVFGKLGAPRLGVVGAGLAAFVATWVGLLIMLIYAVRARDEFRPFRWSNLSGHAHLGHPRSCRSRQALATVVMMFGFGLFSRVVGQLDSTAPTTSEPARRWSAGAARPRP